MRRILKHWLTITALLALTVIASPATAAIGILHSPPAFYTGGAFGMVARMDVAFDQTNKVYLAAWCTFATLCRGQFLDVHGNAIGSGFPIGDTAGFVRVAWGNDGTFAVTYTPTNSLRRYVRFLRFTSSGQPQYVTDPILLATLGNITETESDRSTMVYVPSAGHFLFSWWEWYHGGLPQSYVAAYRSDGTQTVARTLITDGSDGQSNPDLACDFASGRCLATGFAWGEAFGGTGATWGQFVDATSGQRIGPLMLLSAGQRAEDQQVDYSAGTFVVAWVNARTSILARRVSQSMVVGPAAHTVLGCCYGQMSMRYNAGTGSFLLAAKDSADQAAAWMIELDSQGHPASALVSASDQRSTGFMHPTVAPNPASKQFGVVHTQSFLNGYIRIVQADGTPVSPAPAPLSVTLSSNQQGPLPEGTTITWTAQAAGGTGSTEYQFMRYSEGSGWSVAQAYSSSATYAWAPKAGTHAVQVWVRNTGSTENWQAYAASGLFSVAAPQARLSAFSANTAFPTAPGTTVTWTAAATAPGGSVEYKFWRYTQGSGWLMVQDWSAINTFTWIVSGGTHAVQVWVRRVGSTASYEDWRSSNLFSVASSPARLSGLSANQTFPVGPSTTITWTAAASGGSAPLEYKFWLYNWSSGTWSVLRDWSSSSQASWTPGTATGQHALQVWVRSQGSSASYEDWKGTEFFNITGSTGLSAVTDRTLVGLREGQSVTWTSQVSGTSGPWEYQFWTYDAASNKWTVQRAYASFNHFTWFPTAGTKAVQIWVRQAGSSARYERWWSSGLFTVGQ